MCLLRQPNGGAPAADNLSDTNRLAPHSYLVITIRITENLAIGVVA